MVNLNKFNTSKPEIIVQTYINPSEDTNKVSFAMKNIFPREVQGPEPDRDASARWDVDDVSR